MFLSLLLLCLVVGQIFVGAINHPKLCPNVKWNENASTLFDLTSNLSAFAIDLNDRIYLADQETNQVSIYSPSGVLLSQINSSRPTSVFVYEDKYILIGSDQSIDRIQLSEQSSSSLINVSEPCWGLFVDRDETVYCSLPEQNRVITLSLRNPSSVEEYSVGNGSCGSTSIELCFPTGLYVGHEFDLYVADTNNHRIQRFRNRSSKAECILGTGGSTNVNLSRPTALILDEDGTVFILDQNNRRIIHYSWWGHWRCIIGCSASENESSSSEVSSPTHLAFDRRGNLFLLDQGNRRVEKYPLEGNTCYFYPWSHLCSNATWNENATTFANQSMVGSLPRGLFIDRHGHIYVADHTHQRILVWKWGNFDQQLSLNTTLYEFSDLFVGMNGDIFFEDGSEAGRIEKWSVDQNESVFVAKFDGHCYSLFIDTNNSLYCSLPANHKVMKMSLDSDEGGEFVLVAGNGSEGSAPDQLNRPWGIFVDHEFNLFVADSRNHRIQRFAGEQINGTTVVSRGTPAGLELNLPTDVLVDRAGYLYISDNLQSRIVRSNGAEWQNIAGQTNKSGSNSNQLRTNYALQLDGHRHLYVADEGNHRIQRFDLIDNGCNPKVRQDESSTSLIIPDTTSTEESTSQRNDPKNPSEIFREFCLIFSPCQNEGNCSDDPDHLYGYNCSCPSQVHEDHCQIDDRPCQTNPCFHGGACQGRSRQDRYCSCPSDYEGRWCERTVNHCWNQTCQNKGQCRALVGHSFCECLQGSYSGDECQITARRVVVLEYLSKSFGFVAILSISCVMIFVIVMDLLKYFCGIDPVWEERERIRAEKRAKRRRPKIERFIYVHQSNPITTIRRENPSSTKHVTDV